MKATIFFHVNHCDPIHVHALLRQALSTEQIQVRHGVTTVEALHYGRPDAKTLKISCLFEIDTNLTEHELQRYLSFCPLVELFPQFFHFETCVTHRIKIL